MQRRWQQACRLLHTAGTLYDLHHAKPSPPLGMPDERAERRCKHLRANAMPASMAAPDRHHVVSMAGPRTQNPAFSTLKAQDSLPCERLPQEMAQEVARRVKPRSSGNGGGAAAVGAREGPTALGTAGAAAGGRGRRKSRRPENAEMRQAGGAAPAAGLAASRATG